MEENVGIQARDAERNSVEFQPKVELFNFNTINLKKISGLLVRNKKYKYIYIFYIHFLRWLQNIFQGNQK